jgi:pimeloyl-ACP methyl ester carboxylesterase
VPSASFDDSGWSTVPGASFHPVKSTTKQTIVWLRTTFELPESADPQRLSLDLGARTGHTTVWLNGRKVGQSPMRNGPLFLSSPLPLQVGRNVLALKLAFGNHVGGVRWTGDGAVGLADTRQRGLVTRQFKSSLDESSQTIAVYIPRCADLSKPRPLLVALPGWDGNIHGFSHSRILVEAERRGWLVVVPDPRGNVLYTGAAEEGVLEAIDVVSRDLAVDPDRVTLLGVSMGGAGALQIGYHFPDRFAAIAAFYGDSRYEPRGYVKNILTDQKTADRYSVLLFHRNARNLPVLLVHARDDKVSAFSQSQMLAEADRLSGLNGHRLIAPALGGHSLQVVEDAVDALVTMVESSKRDRSPERVSFKTNAARYSAAYWLRALVQRDGEFGEADVSVDRNGRTLRVHVVDAGLREVRVDLASAGLPVVGDWTMVVDKPTQVAFVLTGLNGVKGLRMLGGDLNKDVSIEQGMARLPKLAAGTWKFVAEGN